MVGPAEGLAIVYEQGFKEAVAVKKAAVKDGYNRLVLRNKLAIEKNPHNQDNVSIVLIRFRHSASEHFR
jgi:hypothetical protein